MGKVKPREKHQGDEFFLLALSQMQSQALQKT